MLCMAVPDPGMDNRKRNSRPPLNASNVSSTGHSKDVLRVEVRERFLIQ